MKKMGEKAVGSMPDSDISLLLSAFLWKGGEIKGIELLYYRFDILPQVGFWAKEGKRWR
jgi:hypothetical protein